MNTSSNVSHRSVVAIEVVDLARNVPIGNCEICVDRFEFQGLAVSGDVQARAVFSNDRSSLFSEANRVNEEQQEKAVAG